LPWLPLAGLLVTSIPSAKPCKVLHNFVDICIRKQKFAELTPVHLHGAVRPATRGPVDLVTRRKGDRERLRQYIERRIEEWLLRISAL
jgi:hypothetical protein